MFSRRQEKALQQNATREDVILEHVNMTPIDTWYSKSRKLPNKIHFSKENFIKPQKHSEDIEQYLVNASAEAKNLVRTVENLPKNTDKNSIVCSHLYK